MYLNRERVTKLFPLVGAVLGAVAGAIPVLLYPPEHPDDRLFYLVVAGGGFGVIGLLCGYLCSLRARRRIGFTDISAVAGVLVGLAGWFVNGKGGRWDMANVFGIVFWAAIITLVLRGVAITGKPNHRGHGHGSRTAQSSVTLHPPITDAVVKRLIDGAETQMLAFYDVSDCQIYGRKFCRRLTGSLADAANRAGCEPLVYQTVVWRCFVFIPVFPQAIYFVISCVECDDPYRDAEQYRGIRATWDTRQVCTHYFVTLALFATMGFAVSWWLR